ncbi:MAG: sigma-70 family RNA polymerase sigma factor [Lachnospiraceae bacterium]|nr:sigma-70 family RNA polymerase sigma factor [Lachnospiraceae bacterium]
MKLSAEYLAGKYQDNIFRAAFSVCRNREDAEDVTQDTFLQYMHTKREFESEEHIKAWLLRTAINKSKNLITAFWHRNRTSLEDYLAQVPFAGPQDRDLVEAVLRLPESVRIVVHLYYYEDYSVAEISELLHLSQSAVKNRLLRGRKILKASLKDGWPDDD